MGERHDEGPGFRVEGDGQDQVRGSPRLTRRDLLKLSAFGGFGLPLEGLLDPAAVRAATKDLKLSDVTEFTTSCNFCSCGCGMIAAVKNDKLITMEGDYDHPVNRGSQIGRASCRG